MTKLCHSVTFSDPSVNISSQNGGVLSCRHIFFKKKKRKPTSQNGIVDFQTLQHSLRVNGQRKHWFVILQKMDSQLKNHIKTEWFRWKKNLIFFNWVYKMHVSLYIRHIDSWIKLTGLYLHVYYFS